MDIELDLSLINFSNNPEKIGLVEIRSVLNNPRSRLRNVNEYPQRYGYMTEIGYSNKKRIMMIASRIVDMKRQILQVKIANEDEIEGYYCNKK